MSLVSSGPLMLLPDPQRAYACAAGVSGGSQLKITAAGQRTAWIFPVPKSGNIDRLGIGINSVTTAATCRLGIYTVDASGNPTTTPYKGSAYATFTPTAGTFFELTLPTPATGAVVNDFVAVVTEFDSTGGSIGVAASNGPPTLSHPFSALYNGTSWGSQAGAIIPYLSLHYDDGSYGDVLSIGLSSSLSTAVGSGSSPNEYGLSFTLPFAARVVGLWGIFTEGGSGRTYNATLYSGTTPLQQIAVAGNTSPTFGLGLRHWLFTSPVTLSAGSSVIAAIAVTSASTITLRQAVMANGSIGAASGFPAGAGQVTRSGAGAWSAADPTTFPLVGLLIDQIDNGVSTGGGVRFLGFNGGFGG